MSAPKTQEWGYPAKVGLKCKSAPKMQRWGQNATVGVNRKGRSHSGVKMQTRFFNKKRLLKMAEHRGYLTERAVADRVSEILDIKPETVKQRLDKGKFSLEERIVIADYFEMTPVEFLDVFLSGVFVEDSTGHYVCWVDNPYEVLHPNHEEKKTVTQSSVEKSSFARLSGKRKQKRVDELVDSIEQVSNQAMESSERA